MAPAPTEEGDAIAKVEEVLADLEEQAELGARRHSRSFSEPNLAARLSEQALRTQKPADRSSDEDDDYYTRVLMPSAAQRLLPCFLLHEPLVPEIVIIRFSATSI